MNSLASLSSSLNWCDIFIRMHVYYEVLVYGMCSLDVYTCVRLPHVHIKPGVSDTIPSYVPPTMLRRGSKPKKGVYLLGVFHLQLIMSLPDKSKVHRILQFESIWKSCWEPDRSNCWATSSFSTNSTAASARTRWSTIVGSAWCVSHQPVSISPKQCTSSTIHHSWVSHASKQLEHSSSYIYDPSCWPTPTTPTSIQLECTSRAIHPLSLSFTCWSRSLSCTHIQHCQHKGVCISLTKPLMCHQLQTLKEMLRFLGNPHMLETMQFTACNGGGGQQNGTQRPLYRLSGTVCLLLPENWREQLGGMHIWRKSDAQWLIDLIVYCTQKPRLARKQYIWPAGTQACYGWQEFGALPHNENRLGVEWVLCEVNKKTVDGCQWGVGERTPGVCIWSEQFGVIPYKWWCSCTSSKAICSALIMSG